MSPRTSLKDRYYNKDKNLPDNQISNSNKDEHVHRFAPRKELLQREIERQRESTERETERKRERERESKSKIAWRL